MPLAPGQTLSLPEATAHYLGTVLRLQTGTLVTLFNGDGHEYPARITLLKKGRLEAEVIDRQPGLPESPLRSLLGLGISKGERMDYAIQKCTELGVSEIFPLFTEFSEVRLKAERLQKRLAHWQKVAISACEQCGRNRPPLIHEPVAVSDWIAAPGCLQRFIFDQSLEPALANAGTCKEAALLIGPEGGFSETEIHVARQNGFRGIRLGPRILRTETAPVAALALLQYLWGDFQA